MSMNFIRLMCDTRSPQEMLLLGGMVSLVFLQEPFPFVAMPDEKWDYSQKVLSCISRGLVLEIETLDILRRKRFIYHEELDASQIVGRVGGETLSWASRNDFW